MSRGYYDARREAATEWAGEIAHDNLVSGEYDDIIETMILDGEFDRVVRERYKELSKDSERLIDIAIDSQHYDMAVAMVLKNIWLEMES